MSSDNDTPGYTTRWQGYSDFQTVTKRIGNVILDAVEAFWFIHNQHEIGRAPDVDRARAASAKIMTAAMHVRVEMQEEADSNEQYARILERWGFDTDADSIHETNDEDGLYQQMRSLSLRQECPDWAERFVTDIRRAGWELGYVQAGEYERDWDDPVEGATEKAFEGA